MPDADSADSGTAIYRTTIQCEECLEPFEVEFKDPDEPFVGACPWCGTYYPEVYV